MRVNNCEIKSETNKQTGGTPCHIHHHIYIRISSFIESKRQSKWVECDEWNLNSKLHLSLNSKEFERNNISCRVTKRARLIIKIKRFIFFSTKEKNSVQNVRPWRRMMIQRWWEIYLIVIPRNFSLFFLIGNSLPYIIQINFSRTDILNVTIKNVENNNNNNNNTRNKTFEFAIQAWSRWFTPFNVTHCHYDSHSVTIRKIEEQQRAAQIN